jgi:predicted nuclease of predicted toxin-antitoxin system
MLLLDNNISPRLCKKLEAQFPGILHIEDIGLDDSSDDDVWEYARKNGFAIVSKDSDFNNLLLLRGYPPKVVWLRCGNAPTAHIESLLQERAALIHLFLRESSPGVLEIY